PNADMPTSDYTGSHRHTTTSPPSHALAPLSSRPRMLRSISANQFWLMLRMGNRMSGSGPPRYSTSGAQQRAPRYARESVVLAAPPSIATPLRSSAAASARAAYRLGSGSAKLSVAGLRPSATVPSAQMSGVPGLRKKLSPIVELESAGTVRARFSNVNSARSGDQVITGGVSTAGPGVILKSTLLS